MRGTRPAFTLIELIIVITIIAILAALTTGAVMRYYAVQQQTNTETTIRKVEGHLKEQWDTVIRQARDEQISPQAMAIAGGPGFTKQARVIHIKLRLKQEFPMDFNEIANPYPTDLPPLKVYQDAITAMPANASLTISTPRSVTPLETSTCLYLALQRSRGGSSLNFDDLGSNAVATDNSGYQKWIVDGWRTPIVFYRWATKNDELDRLHPQGLQFAYRDTQDPDGALFNRDWWIANHNFPAWTSFENQLHSLAQPKPSYPQAPQQDPAWPYVPYPPGPPFPIPSSPLPPFPVTGGPYGSLTNPQPAPYYVWAYEFYTVPVVASAGPNKNFGIYFPNLTPSPPSGTCFSTPNLMLSIPATDATNYPSNIGAYGDDSDNIYSYRLRLGARGD